MIQANIDSILATAAQIAWVLFGIYSVAVVGYTIWKRGLILGFLQLLSFRILIPLLLAIFLQLFSMAIVFIPPEQVGVIVSVVSPGGVRPQPLRPGLHWIIPFLESEYRYPIYWQTYTMSNKPDEGAKFGDDSIRARTSDGQEVRLDCSIIFRIDIDQAVSVHIDWQDRYLEDLVRPLIRGMVRRQVSQFTVQEVNSSARKDLEALLGRLLREDLADKGFTMDQFLLRDITFTTEYADAVENKQVALEGRTQAEYEAQRIENLAKGRAEAIRIEAQAQKDALNLIAEALATNQDLLTYRYIEELSPNIRVMLLPSNAPLLLPLDSLMASDQISATVPLEPAATPAPTPASPGTEP